MTKSIAKSTSEKTKPAVKESKPKKKAAESWTVDFVFEKETKGTVRFKEVKDGKPVELIDSLIGTLYIRKEKLGTKIPQSLTVTVTAK